MNIVKVPIDAIKPYEKNPRHNEDAIEKVARSIEEFGFVQPIVVDKDSVIIIGHTRLLAAKSIGMFEVPVLVAADLDKAKVKALRLVDNKVGEISIWNNELMNLEIDEIKEFDIEFEMEDFGFEKLVNDAFSDEEDDGINDNAFDESSGESKSNAVSGLMIEFESSDEKAEALTKLGLTVDNGFITWSKLLPYLK
jgi:site-specific DNA-methyltransferase (adenine-specific)